MSIQTDPYIKRDPPNLGIQTELVISLTGEASVGTDKAAWYAQHSYIIERVSVYSTDAPTVSGLIVDCHKNGTTIFTVQENRPHISAEEHSGDSETPDVASISKGDRISFDEDQVGSGTPGGNPLMITMVLIKRG